MSPAETRALIAICDSSNAEMAEALGIHSTVMVRRMMTGREAVWPETAKRLVELAADTLARQLLRALNAVAGGRVGTVALTLDAGALARDGLKALSPETAEALRAAVLTQLGEAGVKVSTQAGERS